MSYSAEVLADSPTAYWRLGEPSGATAEDATANNHDGTYSGPTLAATGLLDGDADTAPTFDGTNDKATVADATWLDDLLTGSYSIEFWFQTSYGGDQRFCGKVEDPVLGPGRFVLGDVILLGSGQVYFYTGHNQDVNALQSIATGLNDGEPHHLVAVRDGTDLRLYVDGSLDTSRTENASFPPIANAAVFTIGHDGYTRVGAGTEYFNGTLDEVALYASVLSGPRIRAHFCTGQPTRCKFPLCLFPRNDDLDSPLLPQFHDSSERSARLGGGDTFA